MSKHYIKHEDIAHGWFAVPRLELKQLGIESQVSEHSYQKNSTVYLEEDCDALLFFNALEAQGYGAFEDHTIEYVYKVRSPVRGYEDYAPE
tara:strand:+ start:69 stop:341 length:273 start_codon:yes stop_codon:yes gene_type:complete